MIYRLLKAEDYNKIDNVVDRAFLDKLIEREYSSIDELIKNLKVKFTIRYEDIELLKDGIFSEAKVYYGAADYVIAKITKNNFFKQKFNL